MELQEFLDYAKARDEQGDPFFRNAALMMLRYPVSMEQFVLDPAYLGETSIFLANLQALTELNTPNGLRIGGNFTEAILTGGIGVGKTDVAAISLAYQVYVLSCFKSPQSLYGLSPKSGIVTVIQAPTELLAKRVGYDRIRQMVDQSPYFRRHFRPDPKIRTELRFPRGVVIRPLSGSDTAALGQNVLCGLLDEVAFAGYVERSKRVRGEEFDQAARQYHSIATRRKSRFLKGGKLPGLLCLVSSPQHPDSLIERKLREAKDDPSIFVYQKRLWDVKPNDYGPERFRVFVGDDVRSPRILGDDEQSEDGLTDEIPAEFRNDFERDIDSAIRDLAGQATLSVHPFLRNRDAVAAIFRGTSILATDTTDRPADGVAFSLRDCTRPDLTRWAHVDLAVSAVSGDM